MTLISLLLVLLIERVTTKSQYWQADLYVSKYLEKTEKLSQSQSTTAPLGMLAVIIVPCLILYFIVHELTGGLVELILSTALLMVCIGCPEVRASYKSFLQAPNRGDLQACSLYAEQINEPGQGLESYGQNLVWQNYRHYAAVILWFTALGAAGAVLYVLARSAQIRYAQSESPAYEQASKIMNVLDWVPVRITALGFLLVGHFSRAFPVWLGYFADTTVSAKTLLIDVSKQAEDIEPDESDCTEEPCTLVRLAKRNIMFLMVVIAILSLSGWIN